MKNESSNPMMHQPDNKPMGGAPSVKPVSNKSAGHTPTPVGKTSAPWQAGHGTGKSTGTDPIGKSNLG